MVVASGALHMMLQWSVGGEDSGFEDGVSDSREVSFSSSFFLVTCVYCWMMDQGLWSVCDGG